MVKEILKKNHVLDYVVGGEFFTVGIIFTLLINKLTKEIINFCSCCFMFKTNNFERCEHD